MKHCLEQGHIHSSRLGYQEEVPILLVSFQTLLGLHSLRRLCLSNCSLSDNALPADIESLSSLLHLDLCFNNFSRLPDTIVHLSSFESLWLNGCTMLRSIPLLARNVVYLLASNCSSLKSVLDVSNLEKQTGNDT